jgi:Raf kinase inhibitor-like YbhB/YbcL family protein
MTLTSPAFRPGGPIPRHHTGDGMDLSPPLIWTDPPDGTRSFALVCDDPDAPGKVWTHWLAWDLPPVLRGLPEAVPADPDLDDGSEQGTNSFGYVGYGGPAPPRGAPHRYVFRLYALDQPVGLSAGATKQEVLAAMVGHVLAEAELIGTYQRGG